MVTFTKPSGYTSTPTDLGGNDAKDSDANLAGSTGTITLVSGQSDLTIDAGFYKPASLGDYVWEDKNGDGQQVGEPVIKNAIVTILDNLGNPAKDNDGNTIAATTTDINGFYQFTNLKPGVEYVVKFEAP